MTGYGRGKSESGGLAVTVEIRSVNHRFLDLKLRGAALEPKHEEALRKRVGAVVTRGSVSVSIRLDQKSGATEMHVDPDAAERVHAQLLALAKRLNLSAEVSLSFLCSQSGVMVAGNQEETDSAELGSCVLTAADIALAELTTMRATEGASLQADMQERLQTLRAYTAQLGDLAKTTPAEAQERLEGRITKLLKNSKIEVDEARLAQEVALLADKLDVTEELVRLSSHFEQLGLLVKDTVPVGRRLDFLVQELGREFNTVTSKSQSANIARLVVDAKAELEKIREQVQNVE